MTSAVFNELNGNEKTITTIVDMSLHIITQNIDTKKEREIAGDIVIAKSKQKNIDVKKGKKCFEKNQSFR